MIEIKRGLYMKHVTVFRWLSVMLVLLIVSAAIGCGKKASQEPTPTPTAVSTPTATPTEPSGETGSLSGVTGDVQVLRSWSSSWIAATSGMKIGTSDSLKTGSDGYVLIRFFDGSVMEVEADSEISVEELSKASGGSTTVRISQVLGNTINRVENLVDSSSTYEVETLAGSAVVRGTIYRMFVSPYGAITRACCFTMDEEDKEEHSVAFTGGGVTVNVLENMAACAMEGGIPGSPFYPDQNDDPLQFTTGDSGGGCSGECCPPCYPIGDRFIDGYGLHELYFLDGQDGIEECICPCGGQTYGYCEEGYYCSGEGSFQCVPICAGLGSPCQITDNCCSPYLCISGYCSGGG
jgi:hypothetical protein